MHLKGQQSVPLIFVDIFFRKKMPSEAGHGRECTCQVCIEQSLLFQIQTPTDSAWHFKYR